MRYAARLGCTGPKRLRPGLLRCAGDEATWRGPPEVVMRIVYTLLLLLIGFGAGAAVAGHASHRELPSPAQPAAAATPAPAEGQRDPKADLEGQMMWDPTSGTYLGG